MTTCTLNGTRHEVLSMHTHLGVCPLHSRSEGLDLLGAHLLHVGDQVDVLLSVPLRPAQLPFRLAPLSLSMSCMLQLRGQGNRPGAHQCGLGGAGLSMAVQASKTLRVKSSQRACGVFLPLSTWHAKERTLHACFFTSYAHPSTIQACTHRCSA